MYGTVEVLSRYVIMDKLNNSLTYHPWFQSQWSKSVCQLSAIEALQLCLSFENVEIDGERCPSPNYQLNIITISEDTIKRHNLSTSNNEQTIREQAEQFSSFLNVPILHHTDYLPKQYKDLPSFIRYIVGQMRKKKEDGHHGI